MKHYTKNTVSVRAWCNRCRAHTDHEVHGGRMGACIPCVNRLEEKHALKEAKKSMLRAEQSSLFGGRQ